MQLHVRPVWKQDRFYCSYQDQQPGADHLLLLKEWSQNAVLDWTGYHGSEETQGTVPVLSVYVPKESGYGFLGIQADLRGENQFVTGTAYFFDTKPAPAAWWSMESTMITLSDSKVITGSNPASLKALLQECGYCDVAPGVRTAYLSGQKDGPYRKMPEDEPQEGQPGVPHAQRGYRLLYQKIFRSRW